MKRRKRQGGQQIVIDSEPINGVIKVNSDEIFKRLDKDTRFVRFVVKAPENPGNFCVLLTVS